MNIRELSWLWIKSKKSTIKKTSVTQYERIILSYIDAYIGNICLEELTVEDIIDFCNQISHKLSAKSVQDIVVVLKSIIRFGNMLGYSRIVIEAIPSYKIRKKRVKVIKDNDLIILEKYLLSHLNNKNVGLLICLYTGMRLGEICALKWNNVLLNESRIIIDSNIIRIYEDGRSYTEVSTPKTDESIREIPISKKFSEILIKYRKKEGYVLTDKNKYLDPRSYQYYFKKLLKQLELDDYNFHALRHTFATRCVQCQVDIKSLSEILGHLSVNITLNTYVHSSFDIKKTQLEKLEYL